MDVFNTFIEEIVNFLGISQAWDILQNGNYEALRTYEGITALIFPIIPLLILLEFILGLIYKKTTN